MKFSPGMWKQHETHSNKACDGAELIVDYLECLSDSLSVANVALVSLNKQTNKMSMSILRKHESIRWDRSIAVGACGDGNTITYFGLDAILFSDLFRHFLCVFGAPTIRLKAGTRKI